MSVKGLLLAALVVCHLDAAVIRGTVVENRTGKFLSRTSVTLQPIAGTPGDVRSTRTARSGTFEFSGLAGGVYLLRATRPGFIPVEHGQKRWNSAGQPLFIEADASTFIALRLYRFSAIFGTVVDENDIGLADRDVVAYRMTSPPQIATRAKTDDRGMYRIAGLEPGTYIVRTMGFDDEEGSHLPTFSKEGASVENARMVNVDVDRDAIDMDVRPLQGKARTVTGSVSTASEPPDVPDPAPGPITVTLATEFSRQTMVTEGGFRFTGVMPGSYQLYAEGPVLDFPSQGAYDFGSAKTDSTHALVMYSRNNLRFEIRGAPESSPMQLLARRKDLAGYGPVITMQPGKDRLVLRPGVWEVRLVPPPGYYVSGLAGVWGGTRSRPDTWNLVTVNRGIARFTLSGGGSSLSGIVRSSGDPVVGAPVFLDAWDDLTRQRLLEPRVTWTDRQGNYRFDDLGPGTYRVLATFEYRNPDEAAMELAGAQSIRIEAKSSTQRELSLYMIR